MLGQAIFVHFLKQQAHIYWTMYAISLIGKVIQYISESQNQWQHVSFLEYNPKQQNVVRFAPNITAGFASL